MRALKTGEALLAMVLAAVLAGGCDVQPQRESYTPANFRFAIEVHQGELDGRWPLRFRSQLVDGPIEAWVEDSPLTLVQEDGDRLWTADTLIAPDSILDYRYSWKNATLDASILLPPAPFPDRVFVNGIQLEPGTATLFDSTDTFRVAWSLPYPLHDLTEEMDGSQEQRTLDLHWDANGDTASLRTTDTTAVFTATAGDTVHFSFYLFSFSRHLYSGRGNVHPDPNIYSWFFFEAYSDTFSFRIRPPRDGGGGG